MYRNQSMLHTVVSAACVLIAGMILALWVGVVSAAPPKSPWGSKFFPNVPLTDQDGNQLHFYDDVIKGKVVALNFIFTRCEDSCPIETAKLREVQKLLGDRVGKDIFLYSITIDPTHDTHEVLKKYAEKFNAGPGWKFLTGNEKETLALRKKLGMYSQQVEEADPTDHVVSLILGNESTGQWIKRSSFDSPQILASVLGETLGNYRMTKSGRKSYDKASHLAFTRGEYLFRTRCSTCHTIGSGDRLGPDLKDMSSRRDPAWLSRWMKAPDEMLAEKDPIAMELFNRYKQLAMPNVKLTDVDVTALLEYVDKESAKLAPTARAD